MLPIKDVLKKSFMMFVVGAVSFTYSESSLGMDCNDTEMSPKRKLESGDNTSQKKLKKENVCKDIVIWRSQHHQIATGLYHCAKRLKEDDWETRARMQESAKFADHLAMEIDSDPASMCRLARFYSKKPGENKKLIKALYWYEKAAKMRHSAAILELMEFLDLRRKNNWRLHELGCELISLEDKIKALGEWHGSPMAISMVAGMYLSVYNDAPDTQYSEQHRDEAFKKASDYLKIARRLGDPNSFGLSGRLQNMIENKERACFYFRKGIELHDCDSHFHLAWMYEAGEYVEKDPKKAFSLFMDVHFMHAVKTSHKCSFLHSSLESLVEDYIAKENNQEFLGIIEEKAHRKYEEIRKYVREATKENKRSNFIKKPLFSNDSAIEQISYDKTSFFANTRLPKGVFFYILSFLSDKDIAQLQLSERGLAVILRYEMFRRQFIQKLYQKRVNAVLKRIADDMTGEDEDIDNNPVQMIIEKKPGEKFLFASKNNGNMWAL